LTFENGYRKFLNMRLELSGLIVSHEVLPVIQKLAETLTGFNIFLQKVEVDQMVLSTQNCFDSFGISGGELRFSVYDLPDKRVLSLKIVPLQLFGQLVDEVLIIWTGIKNREH